MNHLLTTKFFAPPPDDALVNRPRLTQLLNDGVNSGHRLFVVSAPAGYGKSTLIAQWLNQASRPFVWLSLDGEDNDLQRFLTYFIAALKQLDPHIGEVTSSLMASPQLPKVNTLMTPLVNDIAAVARPFFLILDDYHFITEANVHEAMTFLLNHQPTQIQLVLATRVEPSLPLPRLRLRGQLTELRSDDLRFTKDEANSFFRQAQLNLNPEALHLLSERTEGWVAGLQMTVLSVQGWDEARINQFITAFSGSNHYIIDYLVDEVLRRQTEEVRDFLAQTAILDRLSAPLCDAVIGHSNSRRILGQLERSNLFLIPLDQQREWFRYHHLFADAVGVELEINPEQRLLLHKRAVRWFEAHNFIPDAIKHALAAEDWLEAGRLTMLAADRFLNNLELGVLESWLMRLPEVIVFTNPELAILKGWVSFFTGQPTTSRAITGILNDLSPEKISPRSWARLVSLRATLATIQETSEAVNLIQEALVLTGVDDTLFRQLNLVHLGLAQRLLGQTLAATASYREAIDLGRLLRVPFYTMHALHELAFTLIELGRPQEVLTLCQQARQEWVDARDNHFQRLTCLIYPWPLLRTKAIILFRPAPWLSRDGRPNDAYIRNY